MMEPICAACGAEVGWDAESCPWCDLALTERKHKRVPDTDDGEPSQTQAPGNDGYTERIGNADT